MDAREYYGVLGLQPFSDGATVDQAYWHLAKTYQTQAITDPRARLLLDELNEAYGVLGTPRLRDDYDARLTAAWQAVPATHGHRRTPVAAAGSAVASAASNVRRSLASLNPFGRRRAPAAPGIAVTVRAPAKRQPERQPEPSERQPTITTAARKQRPQVSDLRASTTEMLARWRSRADAHKVAPSTSPDMTLVDIFRTEQDVESHEDPLAAVMEILKAPPDVVAATERQ